jgi:ArsR family transcriptional regulator
LTDGHGGNYDARHQGGEAPLTGQLLNDQDRLLIANEQAHICKALSDPKRILIIHALRDGERTVSELAEELKVTPANLSQHLAVMRERGLVACQRRGNNMLYSLSSPKILEACDMVQQVLSEQLERSRHLAKMLG